MKSLLDAAADEVALMELVEEAEGELTPQLEAWLNEIERNLAEKCDNYVYVMDALKARVTALKDRAKEISSAASALDNAVDRMKERIKLAMQTLKTNEIRGDAWRFKLSDAAPRLVIDSDGQIPAQFKREVSTWEIDTKAIKAAFERGEPVNGCHLEQGQQLRTYVNKEAKGLQKK